MNDQEHLELRMKQLAAAERLCFNALTEVYLAQGREGVERLRDKTLGDHSHAWEIEQTNKCVEAVLLNDGRGAAAQIKG